MRGVKLELAGAVGTGRMLDVIPAETKRMPSVADVKRAHGLTGLSVGDGQCVAFVHGALFIPPTPAWHRGAIVKGNTTLAPGTVIATFDDNGTYGNHANGTSHTAIYLGQNALGIQVLDQWHSHNKLAQPVHERTIRFASPGEKVDDGDAYHVVE